MTCYEATVTCLGCSELPRCKTVTIDMISRDDSCKLFEPADKGVENARLRVLKELGPAALLPDPYPRTTAGDRPTMAAQRQNLRKLAIVSGVAERSASLFSLKAPDLEDMLKKEFPTIADLDDDEVKELIADIESDDGEKKSGKKEEEAPKRGGRRSQKAAAAEEEKKEEAPPRRGRRGQKVAADEPASGRGRGRGRGRGAKPTDDVADDKAAEEVGGNLGELTTKIDFIGGQLDELVKSLSGMVKVIEVMDKKNNAMVLALTDIWNEGADKDSQIDSVLDLISE